MGRQKKVDIPPQNNSAVINLPSPPLRKADEYLKSYDSWVYASVNAIAQELANIKLKLYKRKIVKGRMEAEEVAEHEALSLLYYVNPHMTHYQLYELTQIYLELTGEAYWVLLRNGSGQIEQLWPLRPDWVTVLPSKKDFIEGYKYQPGGLMDADSVTIKTSDMIAFKSPNPLSPYRGKGAVQAAAMAIDTNLFASEWNRNFFFNSAVPYLILRTNKKPTQAEVDRFVGQWEARFQGRANGSKIAVLSGDWEDPFVFGDKFKDIDFAEGKRMTRDEILGVFRVGKSVLNMTDDVNRANAEASNLNFMERVITPKMTRFVAHLNEFYLPQFGDDSLFFDFEDPAPADRELQLKIYESGKNYWLTPNEIRQEENLPPLEGGDSIYMPFTIQPMETLGNVVDAVKGLFGQRSEKKDGILLLEGKGKTQPRKLMMPIPPSTLKSIRKADKKKLIKRDLIKLINSVLREVDLEGETKQTRLQKGALGWSQQKRDAHWEKMIARTSVQERKMRGMVQNLMVEQEQEVLNNISNNLKHYAESRRKGKEASFLFNLINENKKWKAVLAPYIKDLVATQGREVLAFLGIPAEIDLSSQTASAYLKIDGVDFVKGVNENTRDALRDTLKEGLVNEEGIDQLSKRVSSVFSDAKGQRSRMISRTEVLRSTNFATEEAFRQSQVVRGKEWLTAQDERVDDECAALDGKIIDIEDDFHEGKFSDEFPPLHPNCRCTILPVLIDR